MDYICNLCLELGVLTEEERTWLKAVESIINDAPWMGADDFDDDGMPMDEGNPLLEVGSLAEMVYKALKKGTTPDDLDLPFWGFEMHDYEDAGCVIFSDTESPNIDGLINVCSAFVKQHRPTMKLGFTWGWHEGANGGGGAAVISAEKNEVMNTDDWYTERMK